MHKSGNSALAMAVTHPTAVSRDICVMAKNHRNATPASNDFITDRTDAYSVSVWQYAVTEYCHVGLKRANVCDIARTDLGTDSELPPIQWGPDRDWSTFADQPQSDSK